MKKRGIGFSTIGYSAGFYGGGDPTHAVVNMKVDGSLEVQMGTVDIGQGCRTVFVQIAAEELGVPVERITFTNKDTDVTPYDAGTYASRVTFVGGIALIRACRDLMRKIKEYVATLLNTEPDQVEILESKVFSKGNPEKSMSIAEIASSANTYAVKLSGCGSYSPDGPHAPDPETGAMPYLEAAPFGVCIVEVEVDTGTGIVEVLKNVQVYEIGNELNPLIVKGQIHGGAIMGIGMALTEDAHPYWPSVDFPASSLSDYVIPTAADIPGDDKYAVIGVPHPDGPYGAKGFSEMGSNAVIPAITMAVHNAIGVWIKQFPITPETILRALDMATKAEE